MADALGVFVTDSEGDSVADSQEGFTGSWVTESEVDESDANTDTDSDSDSDSDAVAVRCCPSQKYNPNGLCLCRLPDDDGANVYGPFIPSDCEAVDSDDDDDNDDDDFSALAWLTAVSVYGPSQTPDVELAKLTRQAIPNADSHRFFRRVLLWKCCFDVARQLRVMNM